MPLHNKPSAQPRHVCLRRFLQGFHDPTPIQKRVLPKTILGRKDIIGAAETGSGKTLAFGLPVLSEILMRRDAVSAASAESMAKGDDADDEGLHEGLQALVLCPTRELALQVAAHFREVTRDTGIAVVVRYGGFRWMQCARLILVQACTRAHAVADHGSFISDHMIVL